MTNREFYGELTNQEKTTYETGYRAGWNDALSTLGAGLRLLRSRPDLDASTPEGLDAILAEADKALEAKGSAVKRLALSTEI